MMRSSYGGGYDDDDNFAPNPFRSNNDADLLGTPNPPPPQQQQGMMMQQQQSYPGQQMPPPLQSNNIPDPGSGMIGSFSLPPPSSPHHAHPAQFLSGTMDQNANINNNNNNNVPGNNNANNSGTGIFSFFTSCFRLDSYQTYFDMDTVDIHARLRASLFQFYKPDYFRCRIVGDLSSNETSNDATPAETSADDGATTTAPLFLKGPDLYGPLWISMTFVFLLGVTSNFAAYHHYSVTHKNSNHGTATPAAGSNNTDASGTPTTPSYHIDVEEFEYDLTRLMHALTIVTTFCLGLPTVLWLTTTCFGISSHRNLSWVWWICVYGYSLVPYAIGSLLAWLPWASWIVLSVATVMSGLMVLRNMSTPLLEAAAASSDPSKAAPVILAIPAAHFVLACALKISFYSH